MKQTFIAIYLSLLLVTLGAHGQDVEQTKNTRFLVDAGLEYGGDEFLEVFFTNGEDQTMRAGQGGYLAIGGQFEFASIESLMIRTYIGIKYNTTAADNANIRLTRLPFVFMPYWKINDDFRLGVGATKHLNVKFKGDGFVPDENWTSTWGTRFEFGYRWVALTYTSVKYETEFEDLSANSLGLSFSFVLPQD